MTITKPVVIVDDFSNEQEIDYIIAADETLDGDTDSSGFLDESLITELGVLVMQNGNLFIYDDEHKGNYNLLCAVVDRVKSAVEYLNRNAEIPENDAMLITFLAYACMIYDAVSELKYRVEQQGKGKRYHDELKYFFKDVCMGNPWNLSEEDCLTDEEFFEHYRSLAFAHPYETNRRAKISKTYGTQYSPWVIPETHFHSGQVGLTIYCEKSSETQLLLFDFELLKEYLRYRYSKIGETMVFLKESIEKKKAEWKEIKINRSANCLETLIDIKRVLDERCENFYGRIDTLIDFLSYENLIPENETIVSNYKAEIERIIIPLCDAIDAADYDKAHNLIDSVLSPTCSAFPKLDYHMSKISDCYYGTGNNAIFYKSLAEDALKSLRLSIVIDSNRLDVLGVFILICAVCFVLSNGGNAYD